MPRKTLSIDTKTRVLHQAGYVCGNPVCRCIITLDMHHLDPVCEGGADDPDNLIALCPNCHRRHHNGEIPKTSLRAWKMLLIALNQAYDKHSIDILLVLHKLKSIWIKSDGLLDIAAPIASGLIDAKSEINTIIDGVRSDGAVISNSESGYLISISIKGNMLIEAWLSGNQDQISVSNL